jgi:hypothetical protein
MSLSYYYVYMVSMLVSSYEYEGVLAEGKVYLSQYYYVCLDETLSVKQDLKILF